MKFSVINHDWESTVNDFDSRSEADDRRKSALSSFDIAPDDIEVVQGNYEDYEAYQNRDKEQDEQVADGGTEELNPDVVDMTEQETTPKDPGTPAAKQADPRNQTPVEPETTNAVQPEQTVQTPNDLPDRKVTDDPFEWMPGDFIDTIQGTQAINRKGYAVLSQFYDISVESECVVGPEETDFTYARCEATAVDAEGETYKAHGSAHVDRMDGDDSTLLLELADTRATKRVLAIATGVGAVAVEELKNEL